MQKTSIYLIAEIGINHDGDINKAFKLMEIAAAHNFDAVKFQKRSIGSLYTQKKLDSPREGFQDYQRYKQALEFDLEEFLAISNKAKQLGIDWFASCWDFPSINFFEIYDWPLNPKYIKIPSPMNFDSELLQRAKKSKYEIVASTGFCDSENVESIIEILGNRLAILFHCTASYPCPNKDSNLLSIPYLKTLLYSKEIEDIKVGFSSHSPGLLVPTTAMAFGAQAIEVHVTLDRASRGSDHAASIEPEGVAKLSKYAREMPKLFGENDKIIMPSELREMQRLRKGLRKWEEKARFKAV